MSMFTLAISCLTTSNLPWFMDLKSQVPMQYLLFFIAWDFTFITGHIHNWAFFPLWPSCFILSGAKSCPLLFPSGITFWPGGSSFVAFSYSSWGSHGKYTGVVCHSLLQWIMFCQDSTMTRLSWVALPSMVHSFIELSKPLCHNRTVIHEGAGYFDGVYFLWTCSVFAVGIPSVWRRLSVSLLEQWSACRMPEAIYCSLVWKASALLVMEHCCQSQEGFSSGDTREIL